MTATLKPVMQMFSHLRAVEDLEPLPLSEAEVILGPGFVVIQSHKQGHSCRESRGRGWGWAGLSQAIISVFLLVSWLFLLLCQQRKNKAAHKPCWVVLLDTTPSCCSWTKMPSDLNLSKTRVSSRNAEADPIYLTWSGSGPGVLLSANKSDAVQSISFSDLIRRVPPWAVRFPC